MISLFSSSPGEMEKLNGLKMRRKIFRGEIRKIRKEYSFKEVFLGENELLKQGVFFGGGKVRPPPLRPLFIFASGFRT